MDASQSFTKVPIDVKKMNVDLISLSSQHIYGPKGVGALYVRKGVKIRKLFDGGYEEFGIRPGIENIPGIIGFSKAVQIASASDAMHMKRLRDRLTRDLLKIKAVKLNGPLGDKRLCNNTNITFKYVEGESLLLHLDARGIIVTTGSACFSESLQPSYVITALGMSHEDAHGSIRFSLSKHNTMKEVEYVVNNTTEVVERLREISPLK
jgi:cysteine desulfurase